MENDASDLIGDVLFMSNLGVSEENIALLKRIPLQDVKDIIDANKNHLKKGKKPNIIQDIANNNQWKESPPSPINARKIGEDTWKEDEIFQNEYYETMTIPSKKIAKIDRSDRIGEDLEIGLKASTESKKDVEIKKQHKKVWKSLLDEVDNILDDC